MLLTISHATTYDYPEPVPYSLLELRLTPKSVGSLVVNSWSTLVEGASQQVSFTDHHDNEVQLVRLDHDLRQLTVTAAGEVVTTDSHGVFSTDPWNAPLWLYLRSTELTTAGPASRGLVDGLSLEGADVGVLHELSARVRDTVDYETGTTTVEATAEAVLEHARGVCQDHAHVFSTCARLLGYPTRYVSGYLLLEGMVDQEAMHAWAESWVPGLGWVGFDVSNRICPDERHVRLATGLDYSDASPVSGIRFGTGMEHLRVDVQVQQQ